MLTSLYNFFWHNNELWPLKINSLNKPEERAMDFFPFCSKMEKFFFASEENGYPHSVAMSTHNESLFRALTSGEFVVHCFVWLCAETDNRCSNHNLSCVECSANKWMRPHKTSVWLWYKGHFIVLIFIDVFLWLFSWFWKSSQVHFFSSNTYL